MKLAIVGSRDYHDYNAFKQKVKDVIASCGSGFAERTTAGSGSVECIVSGGATGTDAMAERFAREMEIDLIVFSADWKKYGLRAGPIRNTRIVNESDYMIAFPSRKSGKGTQDSIRKAQKKGISVVIHWVD